MTKRYKAFISYRHKSLDVLIAACIQSHLERFTVPKALVEKGIPKKLGRVFRDKTELAAAPDLNDAICRALEESESLIVVCTSQTTAEDSSWINREISYFRSVNPGGNIFAVLAEGEPDQVFPSQLRHWKDPNTGKMRNAEPIAADIRGRNLLHSIFKIPQELLRIYAKLLDVDYADLAQRHQQRQRRQIAAAAATALTVILSFTGMLLVKNHQISQANIQLQQQKDALLSQSAQLLTQDAREALSAGENRTAIEQAAKAMDAGDGTLYPYAPAEAVLISALDLLNKNDRSVLLTNTRLEADGPVEDLCVSDDGTVTVLIDRFGGITAFETRTGQPLWSHSITADGNQENSCSLLTLNNDTLLAFSAQDMAAFSLKSGDLLWRRDSIFCQCDEVFLSPDRKTLAYIQSSLNNTQYRYHHTLMLLQTDTGHVLQELFLGEDPEPFSISFHRNSLVMNRGCFSEDGMFFAGWYQYKDENGIYSPRFYLADLTQGTLKTLDSDCGTQYMPLGLYLREDQLLVIDESPNPVIAAQCSSLDPDSGEVLWSTMMPEEDTLFEDSQQISCLMNSHTIYLLRKDRLYFLDVSDGTLLKTQELPGSVMTWDTAEAPFQSLVLENGEYTLSWIANQELCTSANPAAKFSLGNIRALRFWNTGFLQGELDSFGTAQISAGDLESYYGFAAVIPREDDHAVVIRRPLLPEEAAKQWNIPLPEDVYLSDMRLIPRKDGTLALLPVATTGDAGCQNYIVILDPENHSLLEWLPIPEGCDTDSITLLPNSNEYVESRRSRLNHFRTDGNPRILSKEEAIPVPRSDWYDHPRESAVAILTDGTVLTVLCSDEELTLWKNGQEQTSIPLPADLNWSTPGQGAFRRILAAGATGHAVLSHYYQESDDRLESFAVYDSSRKNWIMIKDLGNGSHNRPLALGTEKPLLAAVDADGLLRFYGLNDGAHLNSIPLKIPAESVIQAQFLPGDDFLLLKTQDSRVLIYHTESGECLLYQQLPAKVPHAPVKIRTDQENRRLYLIDQTSGLTTGSHNCLCLHMDSWMPLFTAANVMDFDEARSQLYIADTYQDLFIFQIPSTRELLETANQILLMQ